MLNIKANYTQNSYNKDDFLRYLNTLLYNYGEQYIDACDGLTLLCLILKNIIEHPTEEKYQRLRKNVMSVENGKHVCGGKLYKYFTGRPEGTQILLMLGFREGVHQFEPHWILGFQDRIGFFPAVKELIESKMLFLVEKKDKELNAALKKIEEEKKRVDSVKMKLKGDRLARKEKEGKFGAKVDVKPLFE